MDDAPPDAQSIVESGWLREVGVLERWSRRAISAAPRDRSRATCRTVGIDIRVVRHAVLNRSRAAAVILA
jgi:hypothetical protein